MLIIEKEKISELAKELSKKAAVFAPIKRVDGECAFERYEEGKEIILDYETTVLSIKEFFLPGTEDIFIFNKEKNKISAGKKPEKFIILGLNSRDAEALAQLDEIMAKPNLDYFYFEKRNAAVVMPYETEPRKIMPELEKLLTDPELLHGAVKWSWKNYPEIWEELKNRCLSCGICTYVCPLCYCFSTDDASDLNGLNCRRCRYWTACTLPEFAKITGGYNFHKTLKERYYNWYYHKFVRAYKEYGKSQCVACGRCQKYCPAKIDMETELIKIVEKYKAQS